MLPTQTQQNPACPACACKLTVKKGVRRNRLQTLQVFRCTECLHRFTGGAGKNKTYPLHIILESVSTFNLGYSLTETQRVMRRRYHREIPERTISSWLNEYRPLSTYSRLRVVGRKHFPPETLIRSHTFHHQQVYRFQVHQAKLEILTQPAGQSAAHNSGDIASLEGYLASIETHFPHHLFQATGHRSSKFPAELRPPIAKKENHATRAAALVLPTSPNNKKRHETLQRFMLINDSVTLAVEVPVFLTKEDTAYYRCAGFDLNFESDVITGHIDFLQIRNGYIHILDYKPEAKKETHAHVQLTIYALALARRASLPLRVFKCAGSTRRTISSSSLSKVCTDGETKDQHDAMAALYRRTLGRTRPGISDHCRVRTRCENEHLQKACAENQDGRQRR
jgi:ribosomal protein L37AE/L43A